VSHEFAYLTQSGFLGAPAALSDRPYAIAGVAYDGATTNRPGARFGPAAIRAASHMLCDAEHDLFGVSPREVLTDYGDLLTPNTSLVAMRAALDRQAQGLLERHHVCWLGGDHSITLSLLRAYRAALGRPLALVHFDAHCDTWTSHAGEPSGHGTWVYEALTEGLIDARATTQIGLRSPGPREAREYVRTQGGSIFDARSLRGMTRLADLEPVLSDIRERVAARGSPPLYLSLDIDCLDPGFAPGTGTPEPAGLLPSQVATLLEGLTGLPFVGMDVVEVAPAYDHAEQTSQLAAYFVWTYLCARLATGDGLDPPARVLGAVLRGRMR
jgi:agmatinase